MRLHLIDFQPAMYQGVQSHDRLARNRHPSPDDRERAATDDLARDGVAAAWRDDATRRSPADAVAGC